MAQKSYFINSASSVSGDPKKLSSLIDGTITSLNADDFKNATKIKDYAFWDCFSLTDITMPDNITRIGQYAFRNCPLTKITFPKKLKSIGPWAFETCSLKEINIPGDDLETIGRSPFYISSSFPCYNYENGLIYLKKDENLHYALLSSSTTLSSAEIPKDCKIISENFFTSSSSYSNLQNFSFEDNECNVKVLPSRYFYNCKKIEEVTIPESIEYTYDTQSDMDEATYIMYNCTNAQRLIIDTPALLKFGTNCFQNCNNLKTLVLKYPEKFCYKFYTSDYSPLRTVTNFYDSNGEEITAFHLAEGITKLGSMCFYFPNGNATISEITLPSTIETLEVNRFYKMDNLSIVNYNIRNPINTIGEYTDPLFKNCSSLASSKTVNIGNTVEIIPRYLFSTNNIADNRYWRPTAINFAEDSICREIGLRAFYYHLATEITIPKSITRLDACSLYGENLATVNYEGTIAEWKKIEKPFTFRTVWNFLLLVS